MFCTFSRLLYAERYGNIQLPKGKNHEIWRKNTMVAYGIAKARAMANRTDWNERTEITKAVIT